MTSTMGRPRIDLKEKSKELEEKEYYSIDELAKMGMVEEKIISVDELFEDYTKVWVKQEFDVVVHNGNRVEKRMFTEMLPLNTERLRVYDSKNAFIGIFEYSEERKDFKPVKMFYENN